MNYKLIKSFLLFLIIVCTTSFVQATERDVKTIEADKAPVLKARFVPALDGDVETIEEIRFPDLKAQLTTRLYTMPEGIKFPIAPFEKPNFRILFKPLWQLIGGQPEIARKLINEIKGEVLERDIKVAKGREKDVGMIIDKKNKLVIFGYDHGNCPVNSPIKVILVNGNLILVGNERYIVNDSHHSIIALINALLDLEHAGFKILLPNGVKKALHVDDITLPVIVTTGAYMDLNPYEAQSWITYAIGKKADIGGDIANYREDRRTALLPFAENALKVARLPLYRIPYGIAERIVVDTCAMRIPRLNINPTTQEKNATKYNKKNQGTNADDHPYTVWVGTKEVDYLESFLIFVMRQAGIKYEEDDDVTPDLSNRFRDALRPIGAQKLFDDYGISIISPNAEGKQMVESIQYGSLPPEEFREKHFASTSS